MRVRLLLEPGHAGHGQAVYEQRKGQEIEVATFTHRLDTPAGRGPSARPLFDEVRLREFEQTRRNEVLDEQQLANQQSRTLKRRSRLEKKLAGGSAANGSAPD